MNHPITPLASAKVNHDTIAIELVEPNGLPPKVKISWPAAPTIVDPKRFPEVASKAAALFAQAATRLAQHKAKRL